MTDSQEDRQRQLADQILGTDRTGDPDPVLANALYAASRAVDQSTGIFFGDWDYFLMLEANRPAIRWALIKGVVYGFVIAALLAILFWRIA